jgi:hypothetical protein
VVASAVEHVEQLLTTDAAMRAPVRDQLGRDDADLGSGLRHDIPRFSQRRLALSSLKGSTGYGLPRCG